MLREEQREVVRIGVVEAGRIVRRFFPESHFVDLHVVSTFYLAESLIYNL